MGRQSCERDKGLPLEFLTLWTQCLISLLIPGQSRVPMEAAMLRNTCRTQFETSGQHPALVLIASCRDELRPNRAALLRDVRRVSPRLGKVVRTLLRDRDRLRPPPIGEIWPWLL